jgi:hypothetical protein
MAAKGRPHKLTAAVQGRIVEAVRAGATREQAAAAAGIGKRTLQRWLAQGEGNRPPARFERFAAALREAEAGMVVDAVEGIQEAARAGDWRARAWLLERRHPAEWGRRTAHELTGRDGKPIAVREEATRWDLSKLTDDELDQLSELRAKASDDG